jgi:hypothetical protein
MQARLAIAGVLSLASVLFGACTFGVPHRADGGLTEPGSGANALVPQSSELEQEKVEACNADNADTERLRRAAAFQDGGRYYK